MSHVGVLGGAFNPPHQGHMLLAETALEQLGLDKVLLVPTGEAPHKEIEADPGAPTRLRMAELAALGNDAIEASPIEVERQGPSYTYKTLEMLIDRDPDAELTFLMGADVAAGLEGWKTPERVAELARFGIAERADVERSEVEAALDAVGAADRVDWIRMPRCEVSSTQVRELAAKGEPLGELAPTAVAELIQSEGIYL